MKRICLYLFVGLLLTQLSYSQTGFEEGDIRPQLYTQNYHFANIFASPQKADILIKGATNVDYYTGLLNISIPLGGYSDNDFDIPVSLKYVSFGFRPSASDSPVGYNWSLNVGGAITRTVNGTPDDYMMFNGDPVSTFFPEYGIPAAQWVFQKGGYLHTLRDDKIKSDREIIRTGIGNSKSEQRDYKYDKEPDIFTFSFGSHHGRFIIKDGSSGLLISGDRQYKIDVSKMKLFYDLQRNNPQETAITITAPDGYIYEFGGDITNYCDSCTMSITANPPYGTKATDETYVSAWYLRKIIAPNNREVLFKYNTKFHNLSIQESIIHQKHYNTAQRKENGMLQGVAENITTPFEQTCTTKYCTSIYSHYLDTIYVDNIAQIALEYDNKGQVKVVKHLQKNIRYNLDYDLKGGYYFLKTVTDGASGTYSFSYHSIESLPKSSTYVTDHWGFWNNRDSNSSKNKEKDYIDNIDTYKKANSATADVGLLAEIIYPTGGKEEYSYEPNSYSVSHRYNNNRYNNSMSAVREEHSNTICGGARICRISSFDGQKTRSRRIIYTDKNGKKSGVIGILPEYKFEEKKIWDQWNLLKQCWEQREICDISVASRGIDMDNILGEYHIGYSNVYELFEDGSSIHYTYTTWKDSLNMPARSYASEDFDIINAGLHSDYKNLIQARTDSMKRAVAWKYGLYRLSDNSMSRGLLQAKNSHYANGALAETVKYRYTPALSATTIESIASNRYGEVAYDINIGALLLKEEAHTSYPNSTQSGEPLLLTKHYSYNNNNQLTKETIEYPDGQSSSTIYDYVSNYSFQSLSAPLQKLQELNMIERPIGIYNIHNNELVDAVRYDYAIEQEVPLLKKEYRYTAPNTSDYTGLISSSIDTSKYKNTKTITKTNANHQPVEFEEYRTATPTVLIWGYNGQYVIAEIQNARLSKVNSLLGFETQNQWLGSTPSETDFTLLNSLRTQLPEAHISTYKYLPGIGMTQQTDPSGRTTYYEYDEANRLCCITDDHHKVVKKYEYHYANSQNN